MSGGPRRYSFNEDVERMAPYPVGEWMKWEDHERATAALRARISALENALLRIRGFVANTADDVTGLVSEGDRS